jgi:Protein of unknown function (DUF2934)
MAIATKRHPNREDIERRAYEIYLERGRGDGQDIDDWLLAEMELIGLPEEPSPRPPLVKSRVVGEKA